MRSNYLQVLTGRTKLFLGFALLLALMVLFSPNKAHGLTLNPNPGSPTFPQGPLDEEIPDIHYGPMSGCEVTATPAAATTYPAWASIAGQPWATSTTASFNQASIDLDLNIAMASCLNATQTGNNWVMIIRDYFNGVSSMVPGGGSVVTSPSMGGRNYADANVNVAGQFQGAYNRGTVTLRYSPAGGFTTPGWHTITLNTTSIIGIYDGNAGTLSYICGGQVSILPRSGLDDNPTQCQNHPLTFSIFVDVLLNDAATCVSFTVNTPNITPGSPFSVTFVVANAGNTTWTYPAWQLGTAPGQTNNYLNVEDRAYVNPGNITPGNAATYTFTRTAPSTTGPHQYNWRMVHELVAWIPPECPGSINVVAPAPTPPVVTCVSPTFGNQEYGVAAPLSTLVKNETLATGRPSVTITATYTVPPGVGLSGAVTYDPSNVIPRTSQAFANQTATFPSPGTYNVSVLINFTDGVSAPGSVPCSATITVYAKPYLKTFGADVSAGGTFSPAGSDCPTTPTGGGIYTFTKTGTNNSGASSQFGVLALLSVNQFYSSARRTALNVPPNAPPIGTTFANTTNAGDPTYGGGFGGSGPCITDYYIGTQDPNLPTSTFGSFVAGGGRQRYSMAPGTLATGGGLTVPVGTQAAIYIDGDVFISGSGISFAGLPPAPNTRSQMPNFALIVRGNIYISNSVTTLDGLYVAQPEIADPDLGGRIYTCAINIGQFYAANQLQGSCNSKLTVNGALVARQIKFYRTPGTVKDSTTTEASTSGNIAEVINFTPEMYMAPTALMDPNGGTSSGPYDSIYSLPPVF